jgi:hypothetical protein
MSGNVVCRAVMYATSMHTRSSISMHRMVFWILVGHNIVNESIQKMKSVVWSHRVFPLLISKVTKCSEAILIQNRKFGINATSHMFNGDASSRMNQGDKRRAISCESCADSSTLSMLIVTTNGVVFVCAIRHDVYSTTHFSKCVSLCAHVLL